MYNPYANNLKQVEIAFKIMDLIELESTGSRINLASTLGITPRHLTHYIRKLEYLKNVKISYNRRRETYFIE